LVEIRLTGKDVELSSGLREHIERRIHFALSRFDHRIRKVEVKVEDVSGPRRGKDKRCSVAVRIAPGRRVAIDDLDSDILVAVDRAADRIGRAVAREVERQKHHATASANGSKNSGVRKRD
jgi:ribosomal subunit interface protein